MKYTSEKNQTVFKFSDSIASSNNILILSLKRFVIFILCNSVSGFLIAIFFKDRIPNSSCIISTNYPHISSVLKARLFFKLYEVPEIRFIGQYLHSKLDVIELGSSIGVLSSHIVQKIDVTSKLICVEANPFTLSCIEDNLRLNSRGVNFYIEHAALDYTEGVEYVNFSVSKNSLSSQSGIVDRGETIRVPIVTLSRLIQKYEINQYSLVCDIEGSEKFLIENESDALINCRQIIIELHDTYISNHLVSIIEMLDSLQLKHGFNIVDRYQGRGIGVYVLEK